MNYSCSNFLDVRNLQEQFTKASCHQKLFSPFTVWIDCYSDLKNFASARPSASNFKSFSPSLEQFFLIVGQNTTKYQSCLPKEVCRYLHFLKSHPIFWGITNRVKNVHIYSPSQQIKIIWFFFYYQSVLLSKIWFRLFVKTKKFSVR